MAFEDFLNHTCDIYHIVGKSESPGYNLPESTSFSYPDTPDISGVACHFGVKTGSISMTQDAPANKLEVRDKLTLPIGTDIRITDKVINCDTGYEYTAEQPITIHGGHHIIVYIKRLERQKPL